MKARKFGRRMYEQGSFRYVVIELDRLNMLMERADNKGHVTEADQI
jgi:hypothetical protein